MAERRRDYKIVKHQFEGDLFSVNCADAQIFREVAEFLKSMQGLAVDTRWADKNSIEVDTRGLYERGEVIDSLNKFCKQQGWKNPWW